MLATSLFSSLLLACPLLSSPLLSSPLLLILGLLNRKCRTAVFLPDLNRELRWAVFPTRPQPPVPDGSVSRRTSAASQKICQIERRKDRKNVRKSVRRYATKNVRRYARKNVRKTSTASSGRQCTPLPQQPVPDGSVPRRTSTARAVFPAGPQPPVRRYTR